MKKIILICLVILVSSKSFSQNWLTIFEDAKETATIENKNIIMLFSGSDWCAPCIKLEKYIFETEEFKSYAEENWVLLKLDFPKKKANRLTVEEQEYNNALAEKYNVEGFFPLVVVLDKQGNVIGKTGYKKVDPDEYIKLLASF